MSRARRRRPEPHPAFQRGLVVAFCYRSGQIGFAENGAIPDGALMLTRGSRETVETIVSALARHAYDNKTLLVPGIPEAENDEQAFKAMMTFIDRIARQAQP